MLGAAAWRLSRGPVELAWLAPLLQAQANVDSPVRLTLGGAAIAWEGFSAGLDQPLDIRLTDLVVTDPAGRRILRVPGGAVALSPGWLLLGRLVPRAVELDGVRLHLVRAADGTLGLDLAEQPTTSGGPVELRSLLAVLSARPKTDVSAGGWSSHWSQLRRVRIGDAALDVTDRALGLEWRAHDVGIDLRRQAGGGVGGTVAAALTLGEVATRVAATASLVAGGRQTDVTFRLTPIDPAALARVLLPAAKLAALAAPVALSGEAQLGPDLAPAQFTLAAEVGAGTLHLGQGTAPIVAAQATLRGTPGHLVAELGRLVTAPRPDGPRSTITGRAEATRDAAGVTATATLNLDRVAFADLPSLWPEGVGGPGTRPWIVANVTDGTAQDFHVALTLTAPPDLSDVTLTRIAGGGAGHDVTVHWLRPVAPIVHGEAQLSFRDADTLEVVATAGREPVGRDAIAVRGGRVVFTGLSAKDQFADITADLAGTVPAALGLLGEKRIGLLRKSPLRVQGAGGQFAGRVTLTHLPLRDDVRLDDLQIRAALKLTEARLAGIVAGRDLDHGMLDLTADPDGMHVAGQAALAGLPATLDAKLDFRAGPPAQVLQDMTVSAAVDDARLASFGLDATGVGKRDGAGDRAAGAAGATTAARPRWRPIWRGMALTVEALDWSKPRGQPAQVEARLALERDGLASPRLAAGPGSGGGAAGRRQLRRRTARHAAHRPAGARPRHRHSTARCACRDGPASRGAPTWPDAASTSPAP